MPMKKELTVIILTKNEEKNIIAVIDNVKSITDEILVVDSGSNDKTVELAKTFGAKVIYREWDNDFSAQRNFAIADVKTDWLLFLDADERLDFLLIEQIKNVINNNLLKQYSMFRRIHAFGFEYKHGIFKPDEVIRLFPANKVLYENKVHEHPVCDLPKERLKGYIEHYTYENWQNWWEKAGHYTTMWAEDAYAKGKRIGVGSAFYHAFYGFIRAYIIQLGFIDGWSGLYSSLQHFIYTLIKYLKLYEMNKKNVIHCNHE